MRLTAETFKGTYTALATPFTSDGSAVDYDSLKALCEYQLAAGVQGVVVCGSTGEAATLSEEEYKKVVVFVKDTIGQRATTIAGIGTNDTRRAVAGAQFLKETGVDGILVVTPPYNKPPQRGIVEHFRAIQKAVDTPLIAYNIPGRSAANILPQTLAQMMNEGLIIGVKESTGNMDQVLDTLLLVSHKISVVSGEDSLVHAIMASGGTGVISASANAAPELFVAITNAALAGRWSEARDAQMKLLPIVRAMFIETNPIPVKTALHIKGVIAHPTVRLPLVPAERSTIERIKEVFSV